MSRPNLYYSFFIIGVIFISFFLIISIFGYIFLYVFKKRREEVVIRNPYLILERILISFGIGIAIYISYSYILNIFDLFNFFTAYVIILIFDISFLVFYLCKYRTLLFSREIKLSFKKFFLRKTTLISILIISISYLIIFILYWNIITESIGLIRRDPYSYSENIYFLLDNGSITDYRLGLGYPSGYIFISSGFLLLFPDPLIVYLFIKMASLYYIFLYVIIAFFILKKLFKENYLIFFSLLLISISNTFMARNIINIPSSLATIMVTVSFLLLVKNYSYYLHGFYISAIYLIHPLTLFFYLPVLIVYLSTKLFSNIKNKRLILKGFISISCMLIIIIILLIPYILNYKEESFNIYNLYENLINNAKYSNTFNHLNIENLKVGLIQIFNFDFLRSFINSELLNRWDYLASESIKWFFTASFLGVFVNIFNREKKMIIFNLSVIIVLVSFFLPQFILFGFLDTFKHRSLETFALPIIIMATFFFASILKVAKRITEYLILKSKSYSLIIYKYKPVSKILTVEMIILLILFSNFFIVKIERKKPLYYYYFDDEYVEITLYLKNNADPNSVICHPFLGRNEIHSILYDMNFHHYNITETMNVWEFFRDVRRENTDYLILNNSDIAESWKIYISDNNYFGELMINLTQYSLYDFPNY